MPPTVNAVVVVEQGLVSAYGDGVACCVEGLLSMHSALTPAGDTFAPALREMPVGRVPGLAEGAWRCRRLLERLFAARPSLPADCRLMVATTVGEIDALEAEVRAEEGQEALSRSVSALGADVAAVLGCGTGCVVSAACASSTAAVALAASDIRCGKATSVCVVGCDILSAFTLSGFAALMALDARGARPFDADRKGVSLGEAAAYALLMSESQARQEGRQILGYVHGWGMTCDANHLTGPSRDGVPLAEAVAEACRISACPSEEIVAICAHGTGTSYNDQMEMLAFDRIMQGRKVPLFSVKGGMGHTLGAAGLVELLIGLECLKRGTVPATVGLTTPSPEAAGWAISEPARITSEGVMLTTNSGFGGVNVALLVGLMTPRTSGDMRTGTEGPQDARTVARVIKGDLLPAFVPPKHFARFSAEAQRLAPLLSQRLAAAGFFLDEQRVLRSSSKAGAPCARVGLLVWNRDGSAKVNRAYFADYVASGCVLGRGQLFAATLPTSVASEIAIACNLTGPLLYIADAEGSAGPAHEAAEGFLRDSLAEAVVLLDLERDEDGITILIEEGGQ